MRPAFLLRYAQKLTDSQISQIKELHSQGWKGVQIAKEFGIVPQTVNYHIRGKHQRQKRTKPARDGGSRSEEYKHIPQLTDREYEISRNPTEQQEEALTKRIYAIAAQVKAFSCSRILPPDEKAQA